VNPFLTLQYLLALARTGRPEADTLMAAIRDRAAAPAHDQAAWAEVALPAAEGILAHQRGGVGPRRLPAGAEPAPHG
jgi:hypothetical protein